MKIYHVAYIPGADYDEYDGFVVRAEGVRDAWKLVLEEKGESFTFDRQRDRSKWQITELGFARKGARGIVMESYRPG